MKRIDTLDATRLLGFDSLGDRLANGVDFHDETFDGKLGAKVGTGEWAARELFETDEVAAAGKIDYSKLLGFKDVGAQLSEGVDFQGETVNGKLGAKVGFESMV
jgi:hypothetical protein